MSKLMTWGIIIITGGLVYGMTYAASQFPDWAVIIGSVNTAVVLTCGKLTGFPKEA